MPRRTKPSSTPELRIWTEDFKRDAVALLLDGHSATSIVERLVISGTNLLYHWKKQQGEATGLVGEVLIAVSSSLKQNSAESNGAGPIKRALIVFDRQESSK